MSDDNVIDLETVRKEREALAAHEEEMRLRELIDRSMAYSFFALYGVPMEEEDPDA